MRFITTRLVGESSIKSTVSNVSLFIAAIFTTTWNSFAIYHPSQPLTLVSNALEEAMLSMNLYKELSMADKGAMQRSNLSLGWWVSHSLNQLLSMLINFMDSTPPSNISYLICLGRVALQQKLFFKGPSDKN